MTGDNIKSVMIFIIMLIAIIHTDIDADSDFMLKWSKWPVDLLVKS